MDILRVLQSVEDLIYQIVLWIVFIPKTFAKVICQPRWCHSYIAGELEKDPSRRFEAYMSPILFWTTTGIIPYLLVIDYLSSVTQSRVAQEAAFSRFLAFPWPTRLFIVAVFALGGPLGFSLLIERAKRRPLSRESLRPTFYAQCLCFTPAVLLLLPFVWITLRFDENIPGGSTEVVFNMSWIAFFGWLSYAEAILIRAELNVGWLKAGTQFVGYTIVSCWLTFVLEIVVITLSQGLHIWQ
jgi:hypothetical protein